MTGIGVVFCHSNLGVLRDEYAVNLHIPAFV